MYPNNKYMAPEYSLLTGCKYIIIIIVGNNNHVCFLQIKTLNLWHNSIGDAGIRHLLPIVAKLDRLDICHTNVTSVETYRMLSNAIKGLEQV